MLSNTLTQPLKEKRRLNISRLFCEMQMLQWEVKEQLYKLKIK